MSLLPPIEIRLVSSRWCVIEDDRETASFALQSDALKYVSDKLGSPAQDALDGLEVEPTWS
ncbi:hypothetical protein DJ021_13690 [Phenylobacterium hankyongense]|uniref:Uncharacterized protein n=1 Tax=Phenylobacterium hankyongense TaxID=1813876 RepID=A0A328B0U3_9CAUL|nr:hypothetical protein [Phenylobacterium hankyongense]RAK60783.1 hypothetical protein DJ021_13690 [Phenylobacterium hankyongense]